MNPAVTVYTKLGCPACENTFQFLRNNNIDYLKIDVETNPDQREVVVSMGYRQLPVVTLENGDSWSGHDLAALQSKLL